MCAVYGLLLLKGRRDVVCTRRTNRTPRLAKPFFSPSVPQFVELDIAATGAWYQSRRHEVNEKGGKHGLIEETMK